MFVSSDLAKRLRKKMEQPAQPPPVKRGGVGGGTGTAGRAAVRPVVQARHVTPQAPPVTPPSEQPLPRRQPAFGGTPTAQQPPVARLVKRGGIGGGTGTASRAAAPVDDNWDERAANTDYARELDRAADPADPYSTFYNPGEEEQRAAADYRAEYGGGLPDLARAARFPLDVATTSATGYGAAITGQSEGEFRNAIRNAIPGSTIADNIAVNLSDILSPADALVVAKGPQIAARLASSPNALVRGAGVFASPVLSGGIGRRAAGEVLTSAGAATGMEVADRLIPEDAPLWAQLTGQLGGALLGGGATAGALQGISPALRGADRALVDLPGIPSAVQSGAAGRELGRMGVPTMVAGSSDVDDATRKLLSVLDEEKRLRASGVAAEEIAAGRVAQVSGYSEGLAEGRAQGLQGKELLDFAAGGLATGQLRQTVASLEANPAQQAALYDKIVTAVEVGDMTPLTAKNTTDALDAALAGRGLQPHQSELLRGLFDEGWSARQLQAEQMQRYPDAAELVRRADTMIVKNVAPEQQPVARAVVADWLGNNPALLPSGSEGNVLTNAVRATFTGGLNDSWLTSLLHRTADLDSALRQAGVSDPAQRKELVKQLRDVELNRKYGNAVPDDVRAIVEAEGKFPKGARANAAVPDEAKEALDAAALSGGWNDAAAIAKEHKNLMFWLDFGVVGVQVQAAINSGGIPLLVGLVNRTLSLTHLPSYRTAYSEVNLSKQIRYALDGLGVNAHTGAVGDVLSEGTVIQHIPGVGRTIDQPLSSVIARSTDFQFNTILGTVRNLIYEGNLTMAHLVAKQDITDPVVRRTLAENANAITSFGPAALRASRATKESAVLLSPSMFRARNNLLSQVGRGLSPGATAAERLVAASTIASYATAMFVLGKAVHDLVGVGEFEIDPSKPGFGAITLPNGTVFSIFPQTQDVKLIGQSLRAVAEADPKALAEAWGKFTIGASSPVAQIAEKAAGLGYEPELGYQFGGFGAGRSGAWKFLNLLPIPPIAQPWVFGGERSNLGLGLDVLGVSNFEESGYALAVRTAKNDPSFAGHDMTSILETPALRERFFREHPEVKEAMDASTRQQAEAGDREAQTHVRAAEEKEYYLGQQKALDGRLEAGEIDGEQWREQRGQIRSNRSAALRAVYGEDDGELPDDAYGRYLATVDENSRDDGTVDWDRVDQWLDQQRASDRAYINERQGVASTETEQDYQDARDGLGETGFFDITDDIWAQMQEYEGFEATRGFEDYYDWYQAMVKEGLEYYEERGASSAVAMEETIKTISTLRIYEAMSDGRNTIQRRWVAENPELAEEAYRWGYIGSLDKEEERILQEAMSR